jgi:hypothetical protein
MQVRGLERYGLFQQLLHKSDHRGIFCIECGFGAGGCCVHGDLLNEYQRDQIMAIWRPFVNAELALTRQPLDFYRNPSNRVKDVSFTQP